MKFTNNFGKSFKLWSTIILFPSVFITFSYGNDKEFNPSLDGMLALLDTERLLIEKLHDHGVELQEKLDMINSALSTMVEEHRKAEGDKEGYLGNPLQSFALIRRLYMDWSNWVAFAESDDGGLFDLLQRYAIPTKKHVTEAIGSLLEMQNNYNLKPADIAVGMINDQQHNTLSALDLYTIGKELFENEKYDEAVAWLAEAKNSFVDNDIYRDVYEFQSKDIYELYAAALFKSNNISEALEAINKALEYDPRNPKFLREKDKIEFAIYTNPNM